MRNTPQSVFSPQSVLAPPLSHPARRSHAGTEGAGASLGRPAGVSDVRPARADARSAASRLPASCGCRAAAHCCRFEEVSMTVLWARASGRHARAGPAGRPFRRDDAMCSAMCSASLPTPPTSDEASAYRKTSPTKYRPGSDPTMPRSCNGSPSSRENRKVDPGEVRHEPGAPDHVRDLEVPSVVEHRQAAPHPCRPRHSLDSGGGEVLRPDPGEREASGTELLPNHPPDRRLHGQHVRDQRPDHRHE